MTLDSAVKTRLKSNYGPPHRPPTLSAAEAAALAELYRRGTPQNTLRAWERDLAYITAWKAAAFGAPLDWPETEPVALRFILDHAADLRETHGPSCAGLR